MKSLDVHDGFVGFDLSDRLPALDRIALVLHPTNQAPVAHRVRERRHRNLQFHAAALSFGPTRARAAATMSAMRGILAASRAPLYGVGISIPATRCTGASREKKQTSARVAAISAPAPAWRQSSSTISTRCVFLTDSAQVSQSIGLRLRRS